MTILELLFKSGKHFEKMTMEHKEWGYLGSDVLNSVPSRVKELDRRESPHSILEKEKDQKGKGKDNKRIR